MGGKLHNVAISSEDLDRLKLLKNHVGSLGAGNATLRSTARAAIEAYMSLLQTAADDPSMSIVDFWKQAAEISKQVVKGQPRKGRPRTYEFAHNACTRFASKLLKAETMRSLMDRKNDLQGSECRCTENGPGRPPKRQEALNKILRKQWIKPDLDRPERAYVNSDRCTIHKHDWAIDLLDEQLGYPDDLDQLILSLKLEEAEKGGGEEENSEAEASGRGD